MERRHFAANRRVHECERVDAVAVALQREPDLLRDRRDGAAAVGARVHHRDLRLGDPARFQIRHQPHARTIEQTLRGYGVLILIENRRVAVFGLDQVENAYVGGSDGRAVAG